MGALDGLDAEQRAAVTSEAAPLCILAGAGSGKTRTLTRRIAHRVATGNADPERVLALTFTRKAAGELRSRLAALGGGGVAAGTFHAVALAQLRRRWADRDERPLTVLDRPTRLLGADLAAEVAWAKARMLRPAAYAAAAPAAGRTPPGSIAEAARAYERYEEDKRRRGLIDLDDLVVRCAEALESDPAFAAAQRWRFRHLFVDEFQDVNPAQFRLLRGWLGDGADLCVVGDPEQGIYAWNGADPGLLTRFRDHFPTAEIVELTANHRSTPQVVAAASAVSPSPRSCAASRPDGPPPTVRRFDSDGDEAVAVARAVRDAHRPGAPWSHIAVLARTNAQLAPLAAALDAAGVPHRAGAPSLLDRPEVKTALEGLRRLPPQSLLTSQARDIDALSRRLGRRCPERRDNLRELAALADELAAVRPGATVEAFLGWLPAAGTDAPAGEDAVSLLTFHRAKGLEWPVVFVTGLEDGFVPIAHAASAKQVAEERRLLYVALTRALDELHCSWAGRRAFGAFTADRTPTPWLAAIEAAARDAAARRPADWRRRIAEVRSSLPS